MRKSITVVALLALGVNAAALLLPAQAQTSDQGQPATPPSSATAGSAGQPSDGDGMPGRPGMSGHPEMGWQGGGHAMMGRHWLRHRMAMEPKQRCEDRLARRAGIIAYTITKLNLTAQQKPLWDKVQSGLQTAGDQQRHWCDSLPSREAMQGQTVLDRLNRREQALSAHLQALRQIKPAMAQFYQSLTPDQQAILNHPFHRG